ncbi:MAG: hypothetical protein PHW17_12740 [Desulfobacterales bacterium]|nr:hypothetical protein [Desulfobacterales bacterium]
MVIRVGIDPDIEKSGYAITRDGALACVGARTFFDLCETLKEVRNIAKDAGALLVVTIEAGWLIKKSNWHPAQGRGIRDRIAKNVGENHAAGKLIARWCDEAGIPYELIPPRGKIKSARFKRLTGWGKRTNQDMRDAVMLIWGRQ